MPTPKEQAGAGYVAAIECGGEFLSVGLLWADPRDPEAPPKPLGARTSHRGHRHADVILVELAKLLEEAGVGIQSLSLVAAGRGPGGFTGIRVGLATAQGLAMGLGIPLWPVSSLEVLACNGRGLSGVLAPTIDAKRGEVYGAAFSWGSEGQLEELLPPCVIAPRRWVERLQTLSQPHTLFGSGALAHGLATVESAEMSQPCALHMAERAWGAWNDAGRPTVSGSVDPAYLRLSDAEIAFNAKANCG